MLIWSFNVLWDGDEPEYDWNDNPIPNAKKGPLAGGYFACVWSIIGDLEYWCKCLRLPNSTSAQPCALCPCNKTTIPWYHFSFEAAWMKLIYNVDSWLESGGGFCHIFTIVGVNLVRGWHSFGML